MNFSKNSHLIDFALKIVIGASIFLTFNSMFAQSVIPAFTLDNSVPPCENYVKFSNTSQNATNYLWTIQYGNEELVTPTFEPLISLENIADSVEISVYLRAMNIEFGGGSSVSQNFTVYSRPKALEISGRKVVCSFEKNTQFIIEELEGFTYSWGSDNSVYFDIVSNISLPNATINWKKPDTNIPQTVKIYCDVTSDAGCESRISYEVILLYSEIPESAKLYWKKDMNTFLCVFNNPIDNIAENFIYKWGWVEKGFVDSSYFNSEETTLIAYYQIDIDKHEYNPQKYDYFVEVISKECPICKFTTNNNPPEEYKELKETRFAETISLVNLYPNPVHGTRNLFIDIQNFGDGNLIVSFKIINFTGELLIHGEHELTSGLNHYQIPLKDLDNGNYFLQLSGNGFQRVTKKFIVVNN